MYELTGGAFDVSIGSGLDGLELVPDEFDGPRARRRRPPRPRRHRQGLRGRPHGGAARGVGDRARARPRRLELGPGPRAAAGAARAGRSTLSAPGAAASRGCSPGSAARQKALSASGTRKGDHILDPRTGRPCARPRGLGGAARAAARGRPTGRRRRSPRPSRPRSWSSPTERSPSCAGRCPGLEAWLVEDGGPRPTWARLPGTGRERRPGSSGSRRTEARGE